MSRVERVSPAALPGFEHVRKFWHPKHKAFVAKVLPGEYYVSRGGEWIATILGSCVSACIRDPVIGVGGMNHFMLPGARNADDSWAHTEVDKAHRYGSYAMEHLINDILKQGARRSRLEIKLVGGGRVLGNMTDVGANNIRFVREYLDAEKLYVTSEDLGDVFPRKVFYDVVSGRMRVKKLPSSVRQAVAQEETQYLHSIEAKPEKGEVELF